MNEKKISTNDLVEIHEETEQNSEQTIPIKHSNLPVSHSISSYRMLIGLFSGA